MTPNTDHISTIKDSKTIYRCNFVSSTGEVCENIIEESPDEVWVSGAFCELHSMNSENEGTKSVSLKCYHCPEYHEDGDDKKWNGLAMPAARDMDLREVCEELFQ